jgi:Flp pilus assembly protein protease CpaA
MDGKYLGVEYFWVDLDWMACCCILLEVAYLGGVCVILILKARQVSKGQQSLTKFNAYTSSKYM